MSNTYYFIVYNNIPKKTQKINVSTLNYIRKFLSAGDKLIFVDARALLFKNCDKEIYSYKVKKIKKITIKSFKQYLKKIKKDSYCFVDLNYTLRDYILFFLIKLKKQKIIFFNHIGYFSQVSSSKMKAIKFYDNFFYYINRFLPKFLTLICVFPQVEYYFESSQITIEKLRNSISYKLSKFPLLKRIFYYKKIIRINSKYYDDHVENNIIKKEKFIVYIDNGIDHPDRIMRDGVPSDKSRRQYFAQLSYFLYQLSKSSNMPVYFCYHPKSMNYKKNHYFYKYFNFCNFTTDSEKYLSMASIAVFQISSLVNKAILMNKKIILTKSKLLGNYFNQKLNDLNKQIYLENVDLSKKAINFKKLKKKISEKVKYYIQFINKNHIFENNVTSYDQIKKNLKKINKVFN